MLFNISNKYDIKFTIIIMWLEFDAQRKNVEEGI